ncbi:MAG: DUF4363 family protein [Clostridia bacterium]|nr:DUF4363 family protein [Clostridia bacterium]
MKRTISIIILSFILISIATFEEIYTQNFIYTLRNKAEQVAVAINKNEDNINNEDVLSSLDDLKIFWHKSKNILCYFTNYEKIKSIDESFVKLSTSISHNDMSLASENIAVIKDYSEFFKYLMGFNLNTLF